MFPGRYSEIFGIGERLGCILNFGHSFDAIQASLQFASKSITLAPSLILVAANDYDEFRIWDHSFHAIEADLHLHDLPAQLQDS